MASIQETLRSALGAHPALTMIVADRIYPGEVPDDETPTPWLFYQVPETLPLDQLDDGAMDVQSDVEFHALADRYADAKQIIDAVIGLLKTYSSGEVKRALWQGTSEEQTEDGYHHAARFRVWWVLS
jgi:hypothetical protein